MSEIHTLIIWSNAAEYKAEIESRLKEEFEIIKIFEVEWDPNFFLKNLFSFYAHSQQHLNVEEYKNILLNKIAHSGDGLFFLYVFRDLTPIYDIRDTSSGLRKVNVNIFDLKSHFRTVTGGGHKIHTSDNTFESNKDLTILLGKNSKDFSKSLANYKDIQRITTNCFGVDGFRNISELFYLLNNSIDYIVLRNFEGLPDEYNVEGHGDIDLLVENFNYVVYLTGAEPVFPEQSNRVHYTIKINGNEIPFDFRYYSDNYYDRKWEDRLLKGKIWYNEIIWIPDEENYFYSLLYHAYVHKYEIAEDYFLKLESLAKKVGIEYNRKFSKNDVKNILDRFFDKKQYHFVIPKDRTVIFNTTFTVLGQKSNQYGTLLSTQIPRFDKFVLVSEVYYNEKKNTIIKICSIPIAKNEIAGLKKLENSGLVPKLLDVIEKDEVSIIEMEFLSGLTLFDLHKDGTFWTRENIKGLLRDSVKLLKVLIVNNILHRDIKPDNLIMIKDKDKFKLKIIDFGWAVQYDAANPLTPHFLGNPFNYAEGIFCDAYSLGKMLKEMFFRFPSIVKFLNETYLTFSADTPENLLIKLNVVEEKIDQLNFITKEKFILKVKQFPKAVAFIQEWNRNINN